MLNLLEQHMQLFIGTAEFIGTAVYRERYRERESLPFLFFFFTYLVEEVTRNYISKKINPDFKSILNLLLFQDLLKESQEIYKSHPPRDKTLINHSNSPGKKSIFIPLPLTC